MKFKSTVEVSAIALLGHGTRSFVTPGGGKQLFLGFVVATVFGFSLSRAQAQQFWRTDGTSGIWTGANWGTSGSGPFTAAYVANSDVRFTADSTSTFATVSIGNVTVDAGRTVTVTAGGTLSMNGSVRTFDIGAGALLDWRTQTVTANSAAGITKNGDGTLRLDAMTFGTNMNGGFTLNSGTVIVSGAKAFGNGSMTINGGSLQSSNSNNFTPTSLTIGGDFSFAGTGNDIWSQSVNLGSSVRTITNNTTGTATRTFSGTISGAGGLTFSGIGGGGGIVLSGANDYSGDTKLSGGTLHLDNSLALQGSTLDYNGYGGTVSFNTLTSVTFGGLKGAQNLALVNNVAASVSLTVGGNGVDTGYSGSLSGGGSLSKVGTGNLTISGANTYTGITSVTGGKLVINGTQSAATGAVTVSNAGTTLSGSGTVGGATTIQTGAIHAAGNNGIGKQTFSNSLSYDSGSSIFAWELGSETTSGRGASFDAVDVGTTLSITDSIFRVIVSGLNITSTFWDAPRTWDVFNRASSGTFASFELYDASNLTSQVSYGSQGIFLFDTSSGDLKWSAIPEPTSALAGVLLGAGLVRRRRSRA